jgi:hypothetical protein
LTARCGSSTKIGVNDRDADAAILRDALSEVLREELRRQAGGFGFYEPRERRTDPVTGKVTYDGPIISGGEIEYEGSIYLNELTDAIIKAIATRKLEVD